MISAAPLAFADDYPPSNEVAGEVTPSRIRAGECAVFSGRGFSPFVTITVTDNDAAAGTSRTNSDGEFAKQMCYSTDAKPGKHVLKGTGDAPDGTAAAASGLRSVFTTRSASAAVRRTVTATLIVTGSGNQGGGNPQSGEEQGDGGGAAVLPRTDDGVDSSGGRGLALPRTGFPALLAAATGTALVTVGGIALIVTESRHRRRRRQRLA